MKQRGMKTILSIVLFLFALGASAQSNNLEEVKIAAQTNLNQVMIEILSGVKSGSAEIYSASKTAIKKSVDFAAEQAPDVVKQFLTWKLWEAALWCGTWILIASFFFFLTYKLRKFQPNARTTCRSDAPTQHEMTIVFKWIFSIMACLFLLIGVGCQVFTVVKIAVAPKVYIIEYVVALAQGKSH